MTDIKPMDLREIAFKIKSIFCTVLNTKNDETRACGPCAMPFPGVRERRRIG